MPLNAGLGHERPDHATGEAVIERLSHEGRGIARVGGKTVFIEGALPGERVTFRRLRRRGSFDEGVVETLLAASPDRVTPPCTHAGICGGCSLQHLSPDAQRRHKESVLLEQLQRTAGLVPGEVLSPVFGPDLGYRRKARLGVRYVRARDRVLAGFREKRSRYLADIRRCAVLHPAAGERIEALAALIDSLSVRDAVPQVEVAVGEDDVAVFVIRHVRDLGEGDRDRLLAFEAQHGVHIYLQPGGTDSVHPLAGEEAVLRYRLARADLAFRFGPLDFTQVNFDVNPRMVERVVALAKAGPGEAVLDLFCGLGNFSLALARSAAEVVGVEGDAALVERARRNAAENGIGNATFVAADLASPAGAFLGRPFPRVVLDPPRSGALPVLQALDLSETAVIVYVSCNPATLARDAAFLASGRGFRLAAAGIVDMFPHTSHVESIAVFEKPQ
jgi:23S rRNA (uracil1939-C5)-methyltransferase